MFSPLTVQRKSAPLRVIRNVFSVFQKKEKVHLWPQRAFGVDDIHYCLPPVFSGYLNRVGQEWWLTLIAWLS